MAAKLAATYRPPIDKTNDEYAEAFEKREIGAQFTIEVYPSFYAELAQHDDMVPDNLVYSSPRKKPEGNTTSLWKPILPSATLEERLCFAWKQIQFTLKIGAVTRYKPGSVSKDGLMFLYQASYEDMVYLFPDGRIMQVNERALLLEAFRQGVMSAMGMLILAYGMIALALVAVAAPLAIEGFAAAPGAVQSLYLLALQNPMQALVVAEIGASTAFTIADIGFDGFIDSLRTPQGAAILLFDILSFRVAGGGGGRVPMPDVAGEIGETPPPRFPTRTRNVISVDPPAERAPSSPLPRSRGGTAPDAIEPSTAVPRNRAPNVVEPETEPTPGASRNRTTAPDVDEPEPATSAPRKGMNAPDAAEPEPAPGGPSVADPDETMHEGKPMIGKPTDVKIGGDDHELIVTREERGVRVRLCSKSCDYVVSKLKAVRDKLPDTTKNAPARAIIDELIVEGETIDKEFATKADRQSRKGWTPRLDAYGDKLNAAASKYPNIGRALGDELFNERLLAPGSAKYTGTVKPRSWKLTPTGDGAHLFERANVQGRPKFAKFDKPGTPRYYPHGSDENAGQAHLRIHDATDAAGIKLGGSQLTNDDIINAYKKAYADPSLHGIEGDLRLPNGTAVPGGTNVTPGQAFDALLKWADL
ncbi:MAG: hypothetical protein ABI704_11050 [Kofleriaceae bacterium]